MDTVQVRKSSFSLVELVIVVVIIGVIAAIAVPRIGRAAKGAADAALRADLRTMRNAIDMYAAEHNRKWPGADGDPTRFWRHLREKSSTKGNIGNVAGEHIYGPYLRTRVPVPVGPNVGATGVLMSTKSPPSLDIDESETKRGWVFNYETGELIANTEAKDDRGVAYDTY